MYITNLKTLKIHSKSSQDRRFSFRYLYSLAFLFIISSGSVLACHHIEKASSVERTNTGENKFTAGFDSEIFISDTLLYALDQKVPYSESGHDNDAEKDITEKTSHKEYSSHHSHKKANSKHATADTNCCIDYSAGCSDTSLCECSNTTEKVLAVYQNNFKQGLSKFLHTVSANPSNSRISIHPVVATKLILHPSYFRLYESWLL